MKTVIRECALCGCRCECLYNDIEPVCEECWEEQADNLAVVNDDGSVEFDN